VEEKNIFWVGILDQSYFMLKYSFPSKDKNESERKHIYSERINYNNITNGTVSDKPRRLLHHQRMQAHNSTLYPCSTVLRTGYVLNKTVS
jgi:hypothetical protein